MSTRRTAAGRRWSSIRLPALCVPPKHECLPPLVLDPITGLCVPPKQECGPPLVLNPKTGLCECPHGGVLQNGRCVPQVCPPPLVPGPCVDGIPIDFGIEKTGETSPPVDVPWYAFHITVTNHGPGSAAAGTITVTDIVPSGMTFTGVSGAGWTCNPSSGGPGTHITCTYNLATNAGDVLAVIDITAKADGNGPFPPFTNCAFVAPARVRANDTNASNNEACVTVSKPGDLTVRKLVKNNSPIALPPMTFPITVNCSGTVTNIESAKWRIADDHQHSNSQHLHGERGNDRNAT